MNKSIWKKSANIFVCGLLGAAILVATIKHLLQCMISLLPRLSSS